MPIATSSYCKVCEKIRLGGVHGKLLKGARDSDVVCMCVHIVETKSQGESDNATMLSPSLMCEKALKAGTPIYEGYSWRPKADKSFASPVTKKRLEKKTELEKCIKHPNEVLDHNYYCMECVGDMQTIEDGMRCSMHGEQYTIKNICYRCDTDQLGLKGTRRSEEERNNGREIERKYRVLDNVSLNTLHHHLKYGSPTKTLEGSSIDIFWKQPKVDFIRLRENTLDLTVKVTDGPTIEDRVEKNLKVETFEKGLQWATTVFGKPVGASRTTFYVYYLPTAEVTIYEVKDYDQIFLEIEAGSLEEVKRIEAELTKTVTLRQEFKSLFQILFGDK